MKRFTFIMLLCFLGIHTLYAQDLTLALANVQNTNDGVDDYYEADVTVTAATDAYVGNGIIYFNYNTAAFGENVANNSNIEFSQPDGSILGHSFGLFAPAYIGFGVIDNTSSRVILLFRQNIALEGFETEPDILQVTATPKVLGHIKIRYLDFNEAPEICLSAEGAAQTEIYSACGGGTTADCANYPGVQFANISYGDFGCATTAATGNLTITEVMQNPVVADNQGEYFELYNNETEPVNLNGWTISDGGSDTHTISTNLIIEAESFMVLGNNGYSPTNGEVSLDYVYVGIDLSDGADAIILTDGSSTEIDRVAYDGGTNWPNPNGAAMIYTGSNIEDNNDGSLWQVATQAEGITSGLGSPGTNGTDQIVNWLVYDGTWNEAPSVDTGAKNALIKTAQALTVDADIDLNSLVIETDADVTLNSGVTLTVPTLVMESSSTQFSSLIADGTITGTVEYQRHVNQTATTGGNDLITPPVSGQTFTDFISKNNNIVSNADSSLFLFGHFDKTTGDYAIYASTESATLDAGVGYRAATTDNSVLSFEGTINQGTVNTAVSNSGPFYSEWNLIGNPYPSYLNVQDFLNNTNNTSLMDATNIAIYGYDGDASDGWTIYNLNTTDASTGIAPGQGFFVAVSTNGSMTFTPAMRSHGNTDDFIAGRDSSSDNYHFSLELSNSSQTYNTDFYFNANSTHGLDLGYDAAVFGGVAGAFAVYSHLVDNHIDGTDFAIQSLPTDFFVPDNIIPLGLNANQGEQLTLSLSSSSLPDGVDIFLVDTLENTSTQLNTGDYVFTSAEDLNGIGRFFIGFTNSTLSATASELNKLGVYVLKRDHVIAINGQLTDKTQASLYDINGRMVLQADLDTSSYRNTLSTYGLGSGVYVLKIGNTKEQESFKIIIN
ncbi:lamin tail domain-containing protein [Winogradskyella sp.]|uniref:lamin tail domain-containing protein n=1 Tax=Winogradskyella sp. TaxID=1883156 RepID=UPI003BAAD041